MPQIGGRAACPSGCPVVSSSTTCRAVHAFQRRQHPLQPPHVAPLGGCVGGQLASVHRVEQTAQHLRGGGLVGLPHDSILTATHPPMVLTTSEERGRAHDMSSVVRRSADTGFVVNVVPHGFPCSPMAVERGHDLRPKARSLSPGRTAIGDRVCRGLGIGLDGPPRRRSERRAAYPATGALLTKVSVSTNRLRAPPG